MAFLGEVALLQQLGLPRVSRLLSRQPQVSNCDGRRSACGGASTQEAQNPRIGWTWAEHLEDALLEEKRQEAPLRSLSISYTPGRHLIGVGSTGMIAAGRRRYTACTGARRVAVCQRLRCDWSKLGRPTEVHTNPGQSSGFLSLGHHRRAHRQSRFSPFSI